MRFCAVVVGAMLVACGGAPSEEPSVSVASPVRDTAGDRDGDRDGETDLSCDEARGRFDACMTRLASTCDPIAARLRNCLAEARDDATRDTDERPAAECEEIADRLHACYEPCADARAAAREACQPEASACDEARMAARTCMATYDDCEEGRTTFTSCLERVRAACADGATDRYCQDPVAFCEYRASEASECFEACHSLVRTARRTCAAETDARDGDDCPHHDGDRDGDGETDGRDGTGDTGDTGDRDGDGETDGRDGTGDTDDTDDTDGDGR